MPADWTSYLLSWLPFIVFILVWIFLSKQAGRWQMGRVHETYEVQVKEMQRMNALLERIAIALEKHAETSA
jgi:ATP-dependent Zn protease